jgi:hypothetical protein
MGRRAVPRGVNRATVLRSPDRTLLRKNIRRASWRELPWAASTLGRWDAS